MIAFIDQMKYRFGVELLCRELRPAVRRLLAARGYRSATARLPSARQLRDELLVPEVAWLHQENCGVYGRRKIRARMRRRGWQIGRDQTARLMKLAGVQGVRRSKRTFTTKSEPTTIKPDDLVNRRFTAPAPRRLRVADNTYVATWSGFAYVAFVTDVFSRRIVGWRVAPTLRADVLPLRALDMAAWDAGGDLTGLVHYPDHGSNYLAVVYTNRIVELGAKPSTSSIDSYDDALAETVSGLLKTELIRRRGPWRTVQQVKLANLEWVWWWNNARLHGELDYRAPIEIEHTYYADQETPLPATAGQETG
jgi:putative transposase